MTQFPNIFGQKLKKSGFSLIFLWMFNTKQCNQGKILGIMIFSKPTNVDNIESFGGLREIFARSLNEASNLV